MRRWTLLGFVVTAGLVGGCQPPTPTYSMEAMKKWDTEPQEIEQFTTQTRRINLPEPTPAAAPAPVATRNPARPAPPQRRLDPWPSQPRERDNAPREVAGAMEEAPTRTSLRDENPVDRRVTGPVLATRGGTITIKAICDLNEATVRCWSPRGEMLSDMANALEATVPMRSRLNEGARRRLVVASSDTPELRLLDPERQTDAGLLAPALPYPGLSKLGDYLFAVIDPAPDQDFAPIQAITKDQEESLVFPLRAGATGELRGAPVRINFIAEGAPTGAEWSGIRDDVRIYFVVVGGSRLLSSQPWSVQVYGKDGKRITSADALGFPQPGQSAVGYARASGNSLVVGLNLRREFIGSITLKTAAPERVEWDGVPMEPQFGR